MEEDAVAIVYGIFVLGFFILFCFLVGAFWRSKSRSFAGGFFVSLLLSPIVGFIIGLILKPNIKKMEADAIVRGDMKKCPYCAEMIKSEAVVCKHCGKEIPGKNKAN